MEYISVKEAAANWGITPRWVQICCKEGIIEGAQRVGNSWLIPPKAEKPDKNKSKTKDDNKEEYGPFLPLITAAYELGDCEKYIEGLKDEDERNLAYAEYYYFSGQADKAIPYAEKYLYHEKKAFSLSACMIYGYANFTLGNLRESIRALRITKETDMWAREQGDDIIKSMSRFVISLEAVTVHKTDAQKTYLQAQIKTLPKGVRLFGCYVMAYDEYLKGNYERALGIAETAIYVADTVHPIAKIYLNIIAAVALISMKRREEALIYFDRAWNLAKPDGMCQAFGVHHNMLRGLVEARIKGSNPKEYLKILEISNQFHKTRRANLNHSLGAKFHDGLKPLEQIIAILASQGWSNKEIAAHMDISANTVKYYMSVIFQKLQVSDRKQLEEYISI